MTSTLDPQTTSTRAGRTVEQCRYRISAGTRALYAQRIDGHVALIDVPIDHDDRVLLVERHAHSLAELQGIATAYAKHSEQADMPALLANRAALDELVDRLDSPEAD